MHVVCLYRLYLGKQGCRISDEGILKHRVDVSYLEKTRGISQTPIVQHNIPHSGWKGEG